MKTVAIVLVFLFSSSMIYAKEIRIGLIPGNGTEIEEKANIFAKKLEERLKHKVAIFIPKDYQDLIQAMKAKKVDFAFFTAMSYVYAEKEAGAKVLLKSVWEKPYYFSTIISHPESGIENLEDLKGKKIAFVDKKSTSGYLLPRLAFADKKIKYESVFTGNHKASVEMLMNKSVDAVAVFANDKKASIGAWSVYFSDKNFKPKVLWTSQALPTDPFTVRQDFYKENPNLSYNVMFALLEMPELHKKKNLLHDTLGISKMVTANSAQYEPIRKLIGQLEKIEEQQVKGTL